jgi:hypothetical protein
MHESKKNKPWLVGERQPTMGVFFNLDLFEFTPMGTVADLGTGYAPG